jgi:uncharacterized NAD(P)/FAD-binding protein YdhS
MILRGGSTIGPAAVPGNYFVELTVDGHTQRQPFVVVKDARLTGVTDADLREQFELAIKVRDATSRTNEAVVHIRAAKKQIEDRISRAAGSNARIERLGRTVEADLSVVESELYQVRNQSPRDTLNYPIRLNNQFAVLLADVEMGESRPTDQMYTVFDELLRSLEGLMRRLDAVRKDNLAQLNEALNAANLDPVVL